MHLEVKINAIGNISSLTGCETNFSFITDEDRFRDDIGKALYSVESQGYQFRTSDVYDSVVSGYCCSSIRKQFQKVYADSIITVSVKCI